MKIALKLIAGGIWLALFLLFSFYGNGWFLNFTNFFQTRIIHSEFSPEIDFAINIIPWNCFISFLICLPLLFIKNRRANALIEAGDLIVFFTFLLIINLFEILIWLTYFPESISAYSSAPAFSVLEPYALNDGWTPFQFRFIWYAFIIISYAFSFGIAFFISLSKKSKQPLILS